jgi:hypothetical protein
MNNVRLFVLKTRGITRIVATALGMIKAFLEGRPGDTIADKQ